MQYEARAAVSTSPRRPGRSPGRSETEGVGRQHLIEIAIFDLFSVSENGCAELVSKSRELPPNRMGAARPVDIQNAIPTARTLAQTDHVIPPSAPLHSHRNLLSRP